MFHVAITDHQAPPAVVEERELNGIARVECLLGRSTEDLIGRVEDCDGLIVYHEITITAETISRLRRCRVIARGGVGFDNVDLRAAAARGIVVTNVPDYGVDEVADHAMAMMLALNRGFVPVERQLRRTLVPWDKGAVEPVQRLAGRTLGILGLGRIGAAAALRGKGFRMRVIACDPYLRPGLEKVYGVPLVNFETLLAESDVLSIHTPLTDETRGLIGAEAFARMKPGAILVNTARGAIVDLDALCEALTSGHLYGAGIDVLPSEPATNAQAIVRLWQEDRKPPVNLILTPHTAFYSESGVEEIRIKVSQEVARVLQGERPRNPVNLEFFK